MGVVSRERPGAVGAAGALAALFSARPARAAPSADTGGRRRARDNAALRAIACIGSLFLRSEGASRFGRGDFYRGGKVWAPQAAPSRAAAAPAFSPWGCVREGTVEPEEFEDFANPFAHGVGFGPALVDLAEPEAWREWVQACAEARLAEERLERAMEAARPAQEERQRLRRSGVPLGMPMAQYSRLQSGAPLPAPPEPRSVIDARWTARAAKKTSDAAWRAAATSVRERLENGSLRAFGRPGTIEAPWRWIAPHVAAHLKPRPGNLGLAVVAGGGVLYFQATVFDPEGVPPDQAAMAYADPPLDPFKLERLVARMPGGREVALPPAPLELARRAIGRRCLRDNGRDGAEEAALAALRLALRERLRRGSLLAFHDGARVPAEEFADGGQLADIGVWDNELGILVRPLAPAKRAAAVAAAAGATKKKGKSGRTPDWERHRFDGEFNRYREQNPDASRDKVNHHMKGWMLEFSKSSSSRHPGKRGVAARLRELWDKPDPR